MVANGFHSPTRKTHFRIRLATFYRHFRATIKTILETRDSSRIFYFLCLNLGFMVIQMLYGIWTNSLGLISDSIHMFFDCAALAMGLFASVMATWQSNSKFTYGYSRVETLSGFANGLFLCLISIFIVFEAIERLIDPPKMNTNQLLIVSTLGLLVNLVGMFATGHHHHGHSHSDHDHHHGDHNMKGVFLHVLADTLGSVGVIVSTLLIHAYGWTGFDPLASIFIAVLIFASVVPLIADAGRVLILDIGESQEKVISEALHALNEVEGLQSYSLARFWYKDPSSMIGSICLQLEQSPSAFDPSRPESTINTRHYVNIEKISDKVKRVLKSRIHGLRELTVQIDG